MLKYFNSLDNCPIWNFNKIAETGDLRYLLRDYDDSLKGCDLDAVYLKLTNDYRNLKRNNDDAYLLISIQKQIISLQIKHDAIKLACFNLQIEPCNEKMHQVLKQHGYTIDPERSEAEQLYEIGHRASNLVTKWKEKELQYNEMIKVSETEPTQSFDEYVVRLENKLGRELDTKKISVNKWLALQTVLIDEQNKQTTNGGNR